MRDIKIKNQLELPKFGILTQVVELTRYDYIYIKNKLNTGDQLTISEDVQRTWDKSAIAVYFKGYKIGYIGNNMNKIIKKLLIQKKVIQITIQQESLKKQLFMNNLDVMIKVY